MVRCEILVASRYSDYEGSGTNRKSRFHRVGELVRFPPDYAKWLENADMVEILEDLDIETDLAVIEIDEEINGEDDPNVPPPSDSALEYAAEHSIDLNSGDVVGTGANGRIILADVRRRGDKNILPEEDGAD